MIKCTSMNGGLFSCAEPPPVLWFTAVSLLVALVPDNAPFAGFPVDAECDASIESTF